MSRRRTPTPQEELEPHPHAERFDKSVAVVEWHLDRLVRDHPLCGTTAEMALKLARLTRPFVANR